MLKATAGLMSVKVGNKSRKAAQTSMVLTMLVCAAEIFGAGLLIVGNSCFSYTDYAVFSGCDGLCHSHAFLPNKLNNRLFNNLAIF
ncbi:hypothetical protein IGI42_002948 [Enterococcus sp. AZ109]